MHWNDNTRVGSKRVPDQQLMQSFNSKNKKQCFWPCPICNRFLPSYLLDDHINQCVLPSYAVSTHRRVEPNSSEPVGAISPHSTIPPVSIDILSVLQDVADEIPLASKVISSEDTADRRNTGNSDDMGSESGRQSCSTAFDLNCDDHFHDGFFCTQADMSLCTDWFCGLENTAEASVNPRASYCSSLEEGRLRNFGGSERAEPDMRKVGFEEITERLLETDRAMPTSTVETTSTIVKHRDLGEILKDGNGMLGTDRAILTTTETTGTIVKHGDLDDILKDGNGRVVERPPTGFRLYQRQKQSQPKLAMFFKHSSPTAVERSSVTVLQPGMILFKNWLDLEKQQRLVQESQNVAHLFHRPITSGGGKYHIYSMCWGSKWNPKTHRYAGSEAELQLPDWMFDLAQEISREAQQHTSVYPSDLEFTPDVALANFYPVKAEELGVIGLGGHQDLDDSCTMPVVSVSVGDSMTFFYRRLPPLSRRKSMIYVSVDEKAARSCEDGDVAHNREQQVILRSGDVLVFGGESRLIYHGTRHVQAGTRPPGLHMVPGRLNFTFRQTDASLSAQKPRPCAS